LESADNRPRLVKMTDDLATIKDQIAKNTPEPEGSDGGSRCLLQKQLEGSHGTPGFIDEKAGGHRAFGYQCTFELVRSGAQQSERGFFVPPRSCSS